MALHLRLEAGSEGISHEQLADGLRSVWSRYDHCQRVLAIPPDFTRFPSRAGEITVLAHGHFGDRLTDIMPALGTHVAMPDWQRERMFPGVPAELFRVHDWRRDVVTIGQVPAEFVRRETEGICQRAWPVQLNRLVWEGGHDLILSVGQVVPHEVIGMANYNKNLFVGTGGSEGINESHFIGAAYGMERIMGRADTPLRRILNEGQRLFCGHLPLLFVQTVVSVEEGDRLALRGVYVGDDAECFEAAADLARQVNFTVLDREPTTMVVYLDPEEFHSTWLGNKAIYRTRMAVATGGKVVVLAPEVGTFGEDPQIDRLIRKYGYRPSSVIMRLVDENEDLRGNLSAAAHLIHGSSEERFRVVYCPGKLSREEVEGVGYEWMDLSEALARYNPEHLKDGFQTLPDGEEIFFIRHPALGLWASRERLETM
ncbi:MAG: hypothetical protein KDA83_09275 [Planctomycetales bacterium]|nr:hypothetical protein [Planctomycetales bacterium]